MALTVPLDVSLRVCPHDYDRGHGHGHGHGHDRDLLQGLDPQ